MNAGGSYDYAGGNRAKRAITGIHLPPARSHVRTRLYWRRPLSPHMCSLEGFCRGSGEDVRLAVQGRD
jgi:hypothetical protein